MILGAAISPEMPVQNIIFIGDTMSTIQRWMLAIGLFIGINGMTLAFSLVWFFFAVQVAPSCQVPDWVFYMIFATPSSVVLGALVAAVLVVTKAR